MVMERLLKELDDILISGCGDVDERHAVEIKQLFEGMKDEYVKEVLEVYYSPENFNPEHLRDTELHMIKKQTGVCIDWSWDEASDSWEFG